MDPELKAFPLKGICLICQQFVEIGSLTRKCEECLALEQRAGGAEMRARMDAKKDPPGFTEESLRDAEIHLRIKDALEAKFTEALRPTILDEAAHITAVDRNRYYGHPKDNHGNTAALWTAYLQRKYGGDFVLGARDVCLMMVLLKVSRDANKETRDNLVDIAGYSRNAEMLEDQ